MSDKLKIKRLELETASGKEISLTLEEARELHQQLAELFAKPEPVILSPTVIREYPLYRPRWYDVNYYSTSNTAGESKATYSGNTITLNAIADAAL